MPRCPNCSYKLVLLSSRPKYKCALCSKFYPKKEIEVKEFQEFNKRRRIEDIENYEKERKEYLARIRQIKKSLRLLFNGFSKTPKEYRKEYYRKKNREVFNAKAKLKRQNNPEPERTRQNKYRGENRAIMRTYGMMQYYRTKQKALALQYLENDEFKPSSEDVFHSVPTFALSYLLSITQLLKIVIVLNSTKGLWLNLVRAQD